MELKNIELNLPRSYEASAEAVKPDLPGVQPVLFGLAALVMTAALLLAIGWSIRPFPGFLVEHTLVVLGAQSSEWNGPKAGLAYPQRVTHVDGKPVENTTQFLALVSSLEYGQLLDIQVETPDGIQQTMRSIKVDHFPLLDLLQLFLLPYGIGLVYLGIGYWAYHKRSEMRAARSFAFFCITTAIALALLFDLWTTHLGTILWSVAVAFIGGGLIRLALFFPAEWVPSRRYALLRWLPIFISAVLVLWGLPSLYSNNDPWAYVNIWRLYYFYAAFGMLFFLGMMVYQLFTSPSLAVQQQARIILIGSAVAFSPLVVWMAGPMVGLYLNWNSALFLPFLLALPVSMAVAIMRYRLWELDNFLNRALVYAVLTALLVGVYIGGVVILQQWFYSFSQENSPFVIAISTMMTAALFYPLRGAAQRLVELRFGRRRYDTAAILAEFNAALRYEINLDTLANRLTRIVDATIHPQTVGLCSCLPQPGAELLPVSPDDPLHKYFLMTGDAIEIDKVTFESAGLDELRKRGVHLAVPLISQEELIAVLTLGKSTQDSDFNAEDRILLSMLASQAAPAMRVAQIVRQQQHESAERQRYENELRLATLVQQTLLPKEMPNLPGWSLNVHYQPARAVSGDFYDFFERPDGKLALVVGDVTDKGMPAALVMASVRSILRGRMRAMVSPSEALATANDLLCPELIAHMFATCFYAVLDPATGVIRFANAGHNLPVQRTPHGISELNATGMPLGLMPGMRYDEKEAVLAAGDSLLLYSDGLVEAHNPQGELLGFPALRSLVQAHAEAGAEVIKALLQALEDFTGAGWEQEDDISLLYLQRS